jgi:uncharacterized protein (DUF1499 family)
MIPAWLSMLDAVGAIILIAGGIAAAHLELIPAMIGLQTMILGVMLAALAFLIGLIGLWRTANPIARTGRRKAIFGLVVGFVAVAAVVASVVHFYGNPRRFPLIVDITTNFSDSPVFVHAPTLLPNQDRDMGYQRDKLQPVQSAYYGSIKPLHTSDPPAIAFEHVKIVASEMPGWTITYVDPRRMALEGVATSPIFHFKDDFVIEVRPAGTGSEIEMRSRSREGLGDFGANASRIRSFFAMFAHEQAASTLKPASAAATP